MTNAANGTVSVIDTTTNTVIANVGAVYGAYELAVNPAANRLYVIGFSNTVAVMDTTTNTVVATVSVGGAYPSV